MSPIFSIVLVVSFMLGPPRVACTNITAGNTTSRSTSKDVNATEIKANLGSEKKELDSLVCAAVKKDLNTTSNDKDKVDSIATNEKIDETTVTEDKGPSKVIVVEEKLEEFPDNVTKVVVVKEVAEKLPSNATVKEITVERTISKDKDNETDEPKKEITVEKEVETRVCEKEATVAPPVNATEKKKIEGLKAEVADLQEKVKEEETKAEQVKVDIPLCKDVQSAVKTVNVTSN